jgi:FkbM family methyltransferase
VSKENIAEMRYSTPTNQYVFVVVLHPSKEDSVVSKGIREGLFGQANRYPSIDEMHAVCESSTVSCTEGKVFVEAGSALGMVSLFMASRGMTVYAFDPLMPNIQRMQESRCLNNERLCGNEAARKNCSLQNFSPSRFHIHCSAVGRAEGFVWIESEPSNLAATMRGGGSVRAVVAVETIDETVKKEKTIEIMLLTCQGSEYDALLGASTFLKAGRIRNIVWRIHSTHPEGQTSAASIASLLQTHAYIFFRLEAARESRGGPVAMSYEETLEYIAAVRARGGHPNVLASLYTTYRR